MRVLIIASGGIDNYGTALEGIPDPDLIIGADGGGNHCASLGLVPDIIVGDCDSIDPELLKRFQGKNVIIDRHPAHKDETDLELCLDYVIRKNGSSVDILGGLGGRWDMSFGNVLLLAQEKYSHLSLTVHTKNCQMRILHPGNHTLPYRKPQQISLIPLRGDAVDVTLEGFLYSLNRQTLGFGSTQGISNIVADSSPFISFTGGTLLCVAQN